MLSLLFTPTGGRWVAWADNQVFPCYVTDAAGRLLYHPDGFSPLSRDLYDAQMVSLAGDDVPGPEGSVLVSRRRFIERLDMFRGEMQASLGQALVNAYPKGSPPRVDAFFAPVPASSLDRPTASEVIAALDAADVDMDVRVATLERLAQSGIVAFPQQGLFDPRIHQAEGQPPAEGTHVRVVYDGWIQEGRLLRRATVRPVTNARA